VTANSARVRVMIFASAPDADPEAVAEAYHRISAELAGTPGLLGNELMRSVFQPNGYVVMSEWESLDAFREWENGPNHRDTTSPLRAYQDGRPAGPFGIYEVAASY
jgi:heme-degrading monooxygenase HmoA